MGFIEQIAVYVQKYAAQYGIMVHSPIIAQAILESESGTSELAVNAHNYHGLKYKAKVASDYYIKVGSEQNPDGSYVSSVMKWCKFPDMESGVKGYFEFISAKRYENLKGVTDPLEYLEKIKADGYATSLKYVPNVTAVIKKYNLTQYDTVQGEKKMAKVFLSAGHGGSDPGAVGNGLKEKDINLQALLACKEILEKHGVEVVASRTKDENDPVGQEVKEADASGADLAVSFHVNAGGGDGFEAFYHTKNKDGKRLAQLGEKYVKAIGQNSRGIKSGNHLYFVRETNMTAVLFESFFIDSKKDKAIGDTLAEQRAFGVAYANAILEFLGRNTKENQEKPTETKENTPTTNKTIYRVQVGAYGVKSNAEAMQRKLKAAGFDSYITTK
jgi:N-acetylmuramoyl-L-alanine amidase